MLFHGSDNAPADSQLYDIAVLAGGNSAEREISLASGQRVAEALEEAGHQVARFDPEDVDLFGINWNQFDACFIVLHGGAGEDGRVQLQLEELGVPYTGSGPVASRLALSKTAAKDRLRRCGVLTPPHVSFRKNGRPAEILDRVQGLGFPLIVKPDGQGCSLGVSLVEDAAGLAEAVQLAGAWESFLLAERWVRGREFTVAVVDRRPLPALEIFHHSRTFGYDVKFGAAAVRYEFPRDAAARTAQRVAVEAAAALGTRGLARVDLILDEQQRAWVLEVNTVPGMTRHSLAPRAAAEAGLGMPQFCDQLVRLCLPQAVLV
ncbi:MAG: D-alanine--D-alanine ligase [Planctomycetales bacterium]|nr:D-alanine--D-alanine ligase [Planctomycetales bacterium]